MSTDPIHVFGIVTVVNEDGKDIIVDDILQDRSTVVKPKHVLGPEENGMFFIKVPSRTIHTGDVPDASSLIVYDGDSSMYRLVKPFPKQDEETEDMYGLFLDIEVQPSCAAEIEKLINEWVSAHS